MVNLLTKMMNTTRNRQRPTRGKKKTAGQTGRGRPNGDRKGPARSRHTGDRKAPATGRRKETRKRTRIRKSDAATFSLAPFTSGRAARIQFREFETLRVWL